MSVSVYNPNIDNPENLIEREIYGKTYVALSTDALYQIIDAESAQRSIGQIPGLPSYLLPYMIRFWRYKPPRLWLMKDDCQNGIIFPHPLVYGDELDKQIRDIVRRDSVYLLTPFAYANVSKVEKTQIDPPIITREHPTIWAEIISLLYLRQWIKPLGAPAEAFIVNLEWLPIRKVNTV